MPFRCAQWCDAPRRRTVDRTAALSEEGNISGNGEHARFEGQRPGSRFRSKRTDLTSTTPGDTLKRMTSQVGLLLMVVVTAFPVLGQKVNPDVQAETLAACSLIVSEPPTPYGFAKATLVSLWYARTAANRADEIKKAANESNNMFSLVTGLMRVTKTATNDFLCARHSLRSFIGKDADETMRTAADFLMLVYSGHIAINDQMLELYKNLGDVGPALADKISTLQVERDKRWSDLVPAASMALLMMVDTKRTDDPNKTTRLVITKEQKQSLLRFIDSHFPEFKDGTPREKWTDPSKTADMYFKIFEGRKCADE